MKYPESQLPSTAIQIVARWTRRESRFQKVWAVGREDEEDVGVFAQTVHLVEQFKEQGIRPNGLMIAFGADEIHVFEDDGRWFQQPREAARGFN